MNACKNTDKEIWRENLGDFYSPSIHVTEFNGIGINCGGYVLVAPVKKWHECGKLLMGTSDGLPKWSHKLAMYLLKLS